MDEHQVQVFKAEVFERLQARFSRAFVSVMCPPDLTRHKEVVSRQPGFGNGAAHSLLITVDLRRVDKAVAGTKSAGDASLRFASIKLVSSITNGW